MFLRGLRRHPDHRAPATGRRGHQVDAHPDTRRCRDGASGIRPGGAYICPARPGTCHEDGGGLKTAAGPNFR